MAVTFGNSISGRSGSSTANALTRRNDATLRYPYDWNAKSESTDRTVYWLQIVANEQQIIKSGDTLGTDTSFVNVENRGIIGQQVWLYLPGMSQTDSMNYETPDMGFFGRSAVELAQNQGGVSGVGAAIGEGLDQLASTTMDVLDGDKQVGVGTIAAGIGIAQAIPGGIFKGLGNIASRAYGISKDPHTIALFKSVELRTHEFDFTFTPKNEREAKQVESIIKFFRMSAYPVSVTSGDAGFSVSEEDEIEGVDESTVAAINSGAASEIDLAFIHPNTFSLNAWFYNAETDMLEPLSKKGVFYHECVLKSVNVNFDPQGDLSSRPGGYFPSSTMKLTFSEIETLKREDIRKRYSGS